LSKKKKKKKEKKANMARRPSMGGEFFGLDKIF
jgi:hypothetical protein